MPKTNDNIVVSNELPELPFDKWKDTYETLHRWLQIVGKIKLELMPALNHWWHVSLFVSANGLTTGPVPYKDIVFEIIFDFINDELVVLLNNGKRKSVKLYPRTVADFYSELMSAMKSAGIDVDIWTTPVEIDERTPFEKDLIHSSYDSEYVYKLWQVFTFADKVMKEFRSKFVCKASPVQLYWGSFDMALSIYSGNRAPEYSGPAMNVAGYVMKEAMSHEEFACGFWPGAGLGKPAFYVYSYPAPEGFGNSKVKPDSAYYEKSLGEFLLLYDGVRTAADSGKEVVEFFWSTYEAAAGLAKWERRSLEYKSYIKKKVKGA